MGLGLALTHKSCLRGSTAESHVALQVLADDLDQGANGQVTYAINQSLPMPGLYHIDPQTGTITTAAILDREIWSQTR